LNIYDIVEAQVRKTEPGARNLLFLPYMRGGDPPFLDPDAKGAFIGLNMGHNERHLYRSVLEGVAFQLRMILDEFLAQGTEVSEIRLIGGGAESGLWRQIIADVFQREMQIPEAMRAAGCLGAAMAGGIAVGMFKDFSDASEIVKVTDKVQPRPGFAQIYNELYGVFRDLYPSLKESFGRLAAIDRKF
jgi:xylulokinase